MLKPYKLEITASLGEPFVGMVDYVNYRGADAEIGYSYIAADKAPAAMVCTREAFAGVRANDLIRYDGRLVTFERCLPHQAVSGSN